MRALSITKWLVALLVVAAALALLYAMARRHPEDLPWTALDLSAPVGAFTGRKLAGLADDAPRYRALLDQAGVRFVALPAHRPSPECGYDDGVRFAPGAGDARSIAYRPADLDISCPVAAALAVWEWRVVQPAALEDGRRISVLGGWSGDADEARFLRAARDGACDLFAATLSPDYNAAHADHLHLDQAERGAIGWRACR